jgi:hypothetical protein
VEDLGSEQAAAKQQLSPSDERMKEAERRMEWGAASASGPSHARGGEIQFEQLGLPNSTSKV